MFFSLTSSVTSLNFLSEACQRCQVAWFHNVKWPSRAFILQGQVKAAYIDITLNSYLKIFSKSVRTLRIALTWHNIHLVIPIHYPTKYRLLQSAGRVARELTRCGFLLGKFFLALFVSVAKTVIKLLNCELLKRSWSTMGGFYGSIKIEWQFFRNESALQLFWT